MKSLIYTMIFWPLLVFAQERQGIEFAQGLDTLPPFDVYYGPFYVSPYGDLRLRDVWLTVKKSFK